MRTLFETDKEFLRDILKWAVAEHDLPEIELKITHVQRSRCDFNQQRKPQYKIVVSTLWFEIFGLEAQIADLLHEICHVITHFSYGQRMSHNWTFKQCERMLLRSFGLVPKNYGRAYYNRLETVSGNVIWERK